MKRQWAALIAAAVLLIAAEDKKPDAEAGKKDLDKLQGTWTLVSGKSDGEDLPKELVEKLKLVVDKDKFTIKDGENDETAVVTLDPSQKPAAIDVKPNTGETVKGVYELKDDDLKICWSKGGKDRPKGFEPKKDSGEILFVLKREKK
jgi:uncharacterized protein (TIGR03067 family)